MGYLFSAFQSSMIPFLALVTQLVYYPDVNLIFYRWFISLLVLFIYPFKLCLILILFQNHQNIYHWSVHILTFHWAFQHKLLHWLLLRLFQSFSGEIKFFIYWFFIEYVFIYCIISARDRYFWSYLPVLLIFGCWLCILSCLSQPSAV